LFRKSRETAVWNLVSWEHDHGSLQVTGYRYLEKEISPANRSEQWQRSTTGSPADIVKQQLNAHDNTITN
jgi:hypothetical protein